MGQPLTTSEIPTRPITFDTVTFDQEVDCTFFPEPVQAKTGDFIVYDEFDQVSVHSPEIFHRVFEITHSNDGVGVAIRKPV